MSTATYTPVLRWILQAKSALEFLGSNHAGTVNLSTNKVSGWIREDRIEELNQEIREKGYRPEEITLVDSKEYWRNYDFYND